jgi:hypothetical protein
MGYAHGLRGRGARVRVVLWAPPPFGYGAGRVAGRGLRLAFALAAPFRNDVLHYQYGSTWAKTADAYWAKLFRRTLACTYHGDDCRLYSVARERFPARARVVDPGREGAARRRLRRLGRVLDAALVADRELATYVAPFTRRVYVTPLPLHPDPFGDEPVRPSSKRVVLHAASDARTKGSAEISAAVEEVSRRVPLDYRHFTAVSYDEVASGLRDATVVVDQLNSVTSGVFALEALRLGVPVLGEYDPSALAPYQAGLPVVRVSPATLAEELERLLTDAEWRERAGAAGREYVRRNHDPDRVAETVLAVYRHARGGPEGTFHAVDGRIEPLDPPLR